MPKKTNLFKTNKAAFVDSTLDANKNLEWVKRLYEQKPKTIQVPGQQGVSTHLMESAEADGTNYAYPTIQNVNGQLKYLGDDAFDYALKNKTAIPFDSEDKANWFANNGYKQGTGVTLGKLKEGGEINMKANRKTPKKVMNKIMPIKAQFGRRFLDGGVVGDEDPRPPVSGDNPPGLGTPDQLPPDGRPDPWQANPKPEDAPIQEPGDNDGDEAQDPNAQTRAPRKFTANFSFDTTDIVKGALMGANALIKNRPIHDNQNKMPMMYNPRPNGDGTSAIGKFGINFAEGGQVQPISPQERDAWSKMQVAAYQSGYKGDDHNKTPGVDFMKAHGVDPTRLSAYQQDFQNMSKTAPGRIQNSSEGLSEVDDFYGHKTSQQQYTQYQYLKQNRDGSQTMLKDAGSNPLSQSEWNDLASGSTGGPKNWTSNNDGVAMDGSVSKQEDTSSGFNQTYSHNAVQPIDPQPTPMAKTPAKGWGTHGAYQESDSDGQQEYSIDAVRKQGSNNSDDTGRYGMKMRKYEDGGEMEDFGDFNDFDEATQGIQMLGPGSIQPMGVNPYSNPMMVSQGPSHDNGGMPIRVGDQNAEIQGGEGVHVSDDGSTRVFGAMKMPNLGPETKGLAGKTFQSLAKSIAKDEEKNTKRLAIPAATINENYNPHNKFDSLKLGSAAAMDSAFKMRSAALSNQKEHLGQIQEMMQQEADDKGVDYSKAHSIFAKNGASFKKGGSIKDDQEKMLKEHPDWVKEALDKYGQPKAGRFDDGLDGPRTRYVKDYVAKKAADDTPKGISFKQSMGDPNNPTEMPDPTAGPSTYNPTDTGVVNDYISNPDKVHYNSLTNEQIPMKPAVAKKYTSLADSNNLGITDFLGEFNYLSKQPQQVVGQQYKPYLQDPYQVSFQDRRNQNQSTFNEVARQLQGSASAASLAALAGQKYEQDNSVNAEEFRTNQGIYSQITNQNYNTLNDANKMNIGLKDQQYVRQSQAKSNTDAQKAQALASISDKLAKNRYENMNIHMVEQRSGFRYNPDTQQMEYQGPAAAFNPYGSGTSNGSDQSWEYQQKFNKDTGKWEDDSRKKKSMSAATAKWGNMFNS
jgi:hypothetical protein